MPCVSGKTRGRVRMYARACVCVCVCVFNCERKREMGVSHVHECVRARTLVRTVDTCVRRGRGGGGKGAGGETNA